MPFQRIIESVPWGNLMFGVGLGVLLAGLTFQWGIGRRTTTADIDPVRESPPSDMNPQSEMQSHRLDVSTYGPPIRPVRPGGRRLGDSFLL